MKSFRYSGKMGDGTIQEGVIQAADQEEARSALARKNIIVLSIGEEGEKKEKAGISWKNLTASLGGVHVKTEELANFSYELSILLESGITLADALSLYAGDSRSAFQQEVRSINEEVRAGRPFSDSLHKREKIFPPIFSALVKSGEQSGTLPVVLKQLARYSERLEAVRNKIISSASYPMVVAGLAFIVIMALVVYVVPNFARIYQQLGAPIPEATRIFLDIGRYRDLIFFVFVVIALTAFFFFGIYGKTPSGRIVIDRLKLYLWIMGPIFREVAISNFLQTLGMLYERGIKLHEAIDLAAEASGNKYIEGLLKRLRKGVVEGQKLSDVMEKQKILQSESLGMVRAGEKSGEIGEILGKLSEIITTRAENKIGKLLNMMEPALIAFIAFFVGGSIIALAAPILNLSALLNK